MSLAAPAGLAAALLAVPLVLWYVLRSRRPRTVVSSTFLWARTERSTRAAVPWQRFRPDRTFWLILLAILIGALALARPAIPVPAQLGDHTILIVDASGSMLADEEGPSRLELARREAEALASTMGPGQVASVIEAGQRARVVLSASGDPAAVRDALRSVRPGQASADLADAFTLAAALERPGQATVVHLLTDGVIPAEAAAAAPEGLVITAVGQDRDNLAITRLEALPVGAGAAQAFVQVRSFGQRPVDAVLTLAVDGAVIVEQPLRLPPRGTEDFVIPVEAATAGEGLVTAAVAPLAAAGAEGEAEGDALGLDDTAWAVLAGPRDVTVLIAGPGNLFLESALASVAGVTVATAPALPDDLEGIDFLVIDRIPAPATPSLPTLYIAPTSPPDEVTVAGEPMELPGITFQDAQHELLADVDLSGVALAAAQRVTAPGLRPIAASPDGPLILAGRLGAAPAVYIAFDLLQSNLPVQVAWPVLIANTVAWLAGPPTAAPLAVGSQMLAPVADRAEAVVVAAPDGSASRLDPARPRLLLDQVGVWRISYEGDAPQLEGAGLTLAANADPQESDLSRDRPGPQAAAAGPSETGESAGVRVLGRQILAAVLALVVLDALLSLIGWRPWRRRGRGDGRSATGRRRRLRPSGASP